MATMHRVGDAIWEGGQKGSGKLATGSGALDGQSFSFGTRLSSDPGTNPEELIAAAHAGCYAMALAKTLDDAGEKPRRIEATADCVLARSGDGFAITDMRIEAEAHVPGIDRERFHRLAKQAEEACIVSNALRGNVTVSVDVTLAS